MPFVRKTPRSYLRGFEVDDGLSADVGEFFVGFHVHDFELFGMHAGIRAEGQLAEVTFFHLDEMLFILGPETFQHGGMNDDPELEIIFIAGALLEDLLQFALDFHAHGEGTLHLATAWAVRAIVLDGSADAFAVTL